MLTDDPRQARSIIGEAERTMRDIVRIDARPAWRRDLAVIVERGGTIRARVSFARSFVPITKAESRVSVSFAAAAISPA